MRTHRFAGEGTQVYRVNVQLPLRGIIMIVQLCLCTELLQPAYISPSTNERQLHYPPSGCLQAEPNSVSPNQIPEWPSASSPKHKLPGVCENLRFPFVFAANEALMCLRGRKLCYNRFLPQWFLLVSFTSIINSLGNQLINWPFKCHLGCQGYKSMQNNLVSL